MQRKVLLLAETGCRPNAIVTGLEQLGELVSPQLYQAQPILPHLATNSLSHLIAEMYFATAIVVIHPPYIGRIHAQRTAERELFNLLIARLTQCSLLAVRTIAWTSAKPEEVQASTFWQLASQGHFGITALTCNSSELLEHVAHRIGGAT